MALASLSWALALWPKNAARLPGLAEVLERGLNDPPPQLGEFDAVVSSFAIHRLERDRQALGLRWRSPRRRRPPTREVLGLLRPAGALANLEHVASPTDRLRAAVFEAIGEPPEYEDRSDRLLDVETQLGWLRELGFDTVHCMCKWREMAVLAGPRPAAELAARETMAWHVRIRLHLARRRARDPLPRRRRCRLAGDPGGPRLRAL